MDENQPEDISQADAEGLAHLLGEGLTDADSDGHGEDSRASEATMHDKEAVSPPERKSEVAGVQVPGYQIGREIGRGGMGRVYEAVQLSTRRTVALKFILEGPFSSEKTRQRFEREVEILGQLNHPYIVAVHDCGTAAGHFYFVMDYIAGQPLHAWMADGERPIDQTLRLASKICEAVNAAHLRGVIHRDLKPANIRIDAAGEPHILDFGLAKLMPDQVTRDTRPPMMTMTGQFMGSLPWASPEQAEAVPSKIDTRTDVYSLGVILYQMLTGRFPYEVIGNMRDVLDRIIKAEPARPSTIRKQINDEVETIVLKCLQKEPERRYQTAGELARDIQHYLKGEPIEAKRDSFTYMLRKQLRRYRVPATIAAVFVLVVLAGFVTSLTFWIQAEAARRDADTRAEQLRRATYFNQIRLAQAACDDNQIGRMKELLADCPADLRGWEWSHLVCLSDRSQATLRGHEPGFRYGDRAGVRAAVYSADAKWIVSGASDETVRLWDADTHALVRSWLGHRDAVLAVAIDPGARTILSGGYDGTLRLWGMERDGNTVVVSAGEQPVWAVAYSPDGELVVSGDNDGVLRLWDKSGRPLTAIGAHQRLIKSVAFSPDGRCVASAGQDGTFKTWDVATRRLLGTCDAHRAAVRSIAYDRGGERIVTAGDDKTARVWDANTLAPIAVFDKHQDKVLSAAFSPAGSLAVSGGDDQVVRVWDAGTGEQRLLLRGHDFPVTSLCFSPDGQSILSASEDSTLKLWDVHSPTGVTRIEAECRTAQAVTFAPDGQHLMVGGDDGSVRIWNAATGKLIRRLISRSQPVMSLALSRDGSRFAAGCLDGTVGVWDARSGNVVVPPFAAHRRDAPEDSRAVGGMAFSPDGRRFASAGFDRRVAVWSAQNGANIWQHRLHEDIVSCVVFSPDGRWIATASDDKTVRLWDVADGREVRRFAGSTRGVLCAAFSPDGRRIAAAGLDNVVRVWDVLSSELLLPLLGGHDYDVRSVAFSPDGQRIASACADGLVQIWDAGSGEKVLTLPKLDADEFSSAAFSPDGMRLAAGGSTVDNRGLVIIWEAVPTR